MTSPRFGLAVAASLMAMSTAGAASAQATSERPALLNQLVECRSLTDSGARLDCYDRASEALDAAERQGEVVVVDRAQVSETRRQLFGFDLPSMPSFITRGETEERLDAIETTLVRASQAGDGKWTFRLANGSTWSQIDSGRVRFRNREGEAVRIRRAALGSYQMVFDGSRAVRVRRQ
ncbi:hypothetical protein [Brevundimonas lutea]|uniref:hypothetical protein n=1 Tax=Brevundimonas lutea TaxID=2293980 RepID=UPI000F0183C5|nr:hypothetical protein [Brevundimonas lutea]